MMGRHFSRPSPELAHRNPRLSERTFRQAAPKTSFNERFIFPSPVTSHGVSGNGQAAFNGISRNTFARSETPSPSNSSDMACSLDVSFQRPVKNATTPSDSGCECCSHDDLAQGEKTNSFIGAEAVSFVRMLDRNQERARICDEFRAHLHAHRVAYEQDVGIVCLCDKKEVTQKAEERTSRLYPNPSDRLFYDNLCATNLETRKSRGAVALEQLKRDFIEQMVEAERREAAKRWEEITMEVEKDMEEMDMEEAIRRDKERVVKELWEQRRV